MKFYPDVEDKNIIKFISAHEPYHGYWKKSEDFIFSYFEKIFKENKHLKLLDLGCGEGRLVKRFSEYFDEVVALEPDEERINRARILIKKENINNVKFINKTFLDTEFSNNEFDIVLCSHIIQHINTKEVGELFQKTNYILKNKGILLITTNHSRNRNEFFVKNMNKDGEILEEEISKDEFNNLVLNQDNILPIHYFSIKDLKECMQKFKIVKIKTFHAMYSLNIFDKLFLRDKFFNLPFIKKFFGRDVMIIAVKIENC